MQKINPEGRVNIPVQMHPLFRTQIAIDNGVEENLIFKTWGGLGDQICAEPTLRHAIKMFKNCNITLASERPELFSHLKFHEVFDTTKQKVDYSKYLPFETITPPNDSNMVWLFFSHLLTHCVDFPSMCAYRSQLPVSEKEIFLKGKCLENISIDFNRYVHPGKHWQSKTFPKSWWDAVIFWLTQYGASPAIIGADTDDNRSTVAVDTSGCLDLRNKLSVMESVWILQRAKVLLTNDSAPLHMAASRDPDDLSTGHCHIGFVATCKHPDFITHWRHGQWGYNMKNHGKGGVWEILDYCPNKKQKVEVENVGDHLLDWLPDPKEYAEWACQKLK